MKAEILSGLVTLAMIALFIWRDKKYPVASDQDAIDYFRFGRKGK